jgi:cytidylate kinase
MYRAIALKALQSKVDLDDQQALLSSPYPPYYLSA